MEIIVVLIGISLLVALIFLGVFIWSVKSGQYDDTYTPSVRILFDQKPEKSKEKESAKSISVDNQSAK
jgi:cbb3-type cytochrome oxidase maturation protein